jgi:hypothetical protein
VEGATMGATTRSATMVRINQRFERSEVICAS